MIHTPWPYTDRLIARLGASSLDAPLKPHGARSPGTHASDLLKILHPVESAITQEELRLFGILGFCVEDRVERALVSLSSEEDWPWDCVRSDEVVTDGIACSPDILMYPKDPEGDLQEMSIKATWKSSRDAPDGSKFAYYNDQCLTYATPLQTLSSVLLVYFVNGGYEHLRKGAKKGKPPVPQIKGWQMHFTPRERYETWQALRQIDTSR